MAVTRILCWALVFIIKRAPYFRHASVKITFDVCFSNNQKRTPIRIYVRDIVASEEPGGNLNLRTNINAKYKTRNNAID